MAAGVPHDHRTEPVLVDGAREQLLDPLGRGVRREIPVGRLAAQQGVAQAAADHIRGLAAMPER